MALARFGADSQQDRVRMEEIAELERRIAAALERIGRGLERGQSAPATDTADRDAAGAAAAGVPADPVALAEAGAEVARLGEALESERATNAQLTERVRVLRERQETVVARLERRLARTTRQLDAAGQELQRQRRAAAGLREALEKLTEAQAGGVAEPHLINRAMLAELESLRAERHAEIAEMDDILCALDPLVGAARDESALGAADA